MHKKLCVVLLLLFIMAILCQCVYPTDELVFLDEDQAIVAADVYGDISAVVAQDGNCYIRGKDLSTSFLYGVENTEQYNNLYKTLDVSKSKLFTQIYSGADAQAVRLSYSGGVILTEQNEVYLFADTEGYRTPARFCADAKSALLVEDRVYILTVENVFGYREIKTPDTFVPLAQNIRQFEVGTHQNSIWLLSDADILAVYTDGVCKQALWEIEAVSMFDLCSGGDDVITDKYGLAYISGGACYYYNGYGVENAPKFADRLMSSDAVGVAAYNNGVIVLNECKEVLTYGDGIGTVDHYNGEVIAKGAAKLSAHQCGLMIVTEEGKLIAAGSLPDSTSVSTADLVKQNSTGDG